MIKYDEYINLQCQYYFNNKTCELNNFKSINKKEIKNPQLLTQQIIRYSLVYYIENKHLFFTKICKMLPATKSNGKYKSIKYKQLYYKKNDKNILFYVGNILNDMFTGKGLLYNIFLPEHSNIQKIYKGNFKFGLPFGKGKSYNLFGLPEHFDGIYFNGDFFSENIKTAKSLNNYHIYVLNDHINTFNSVQL
jgi:hypothetical protein